MHASPPPSGYINTFDGRGCRFVYSNIIECPTAAPSPTPSRRISACNAPGGVGCTSRDCGAINVQCVPTVFVAGENRFCGKTEAWPDTHWLIAVYTTPSKPGAPDALLGVIRCENGTLFFLRPSVTP